MKKILITFLALGVLASCEFDKGFEEMNVNPNSASQVGVQLKLLNFRQTFLVVDTRTGETV